MSDLKTLQKRVAEFIDARDWRQFHQDPKGTLLALGSELGELMEIYRYTTTAESQARTLERKAEVEDEVADILYTLLLFCEENGIDLESSFIRKEQQRELKYPVTKAKGMNRKYDKL